MLRGGSVVHISEAHDSQNFIAEAMDHPLMLQLRAGETTHHSLHTNLASGSTVANFVCFVSVTIRLCGRYGDGAAVGFQRTSNRVQ